VRPQLSQMAEETTSGEALECAPGLAEEAYQA
jgi:hypothetical protein